MSRPLYHLAVRGDWSEGDADYTVSTLDRRLDEVGFIHCSFAEQVQRIADLVYRGRDDVVLLEIDETRLTAPVVVEDAHGDGAFPHIYGPLNRDAVVRVTPVRVLGDGTLDVATALR